MTHGFYIWVNISCFLVNFQIWTYSAQIPGKIPGKNDPNERSMCHPLENIPISNP